MKRYLFTLLLAATVAFAGFGAVAAGSQAAPPTNTCNTARAKALGQNDRFWERGLVAAQGHNTLAVLSGDGSSSDDRSSYPLAPGAVIRNIAQSTRGVVFVEDRAGADTLVAITESGRQSLPLENEAEAAAWMDDGSVIFSMVGSGLERWSPDQGVVESIGKPVGSLAAFSPVQLDSRSLIAVVSGPVPGYGGGDAALDNLWSFDLTTRTWTPITTFTADAVNWVALKTPVVTEDGQLYVVRVSGGGDSMRFDLLAYDGQSVRVVAPAPAGQFLAGSSGKTLLWNRWDDATNTWQIGRITGNSFVPVGCGRTAVSASEVPDPDLVPQAEPILDPSTTLIEDSLEHEHESSLADLYHHAVVIGGFTSKADAERVARMLRGRFEIEVIDGETSPAAVGIGEWGVAYDIPDGTDPEAALSSIRQMLPPQYKDRTWLSWA